MSSIETKTSISEKIAGICKVLEIDEIDNTTSMVLTVDHSCINVERTIIDRIGAKYIQKATIKDAP